MSQRTITAIFLSLSNWLCFKTQVVWCQGSHCTCKNFVYILEPCEIGDWDVKGDEEAKARDGNGNAQHVDVHVVQYCPKENPEKRRNVGVFLLSSYEHSNKFNIRSTNSQ